MIFKKSKITAGIITIIGLITCIAMHKPASWTAESINGIKIECERGAVSVPENRTYPNASKIEVGYVRLKSFAKEPKSPIFYLAGGPGDDATDQAEDPNYLEYWSEFLKTRDVVLIDQRGVGKFKLMWINLGWPPKDVFISSDAAIAHFVDMGKKAANAFESRGIDLNGYNSIENAHDVDSVRDKLDYEKVIPFGFSYGTHLGQAYLKYHEDRVDKTVLIGIEGLDQNYKLPLDLDKQLFKIGDMVKADTTINQIVPDFMELYSKASNRLMVEPVEIEITTPIKTKRKLLVGKFGLDFILKRDLGDASDIPYFPRLLYNVAEGDGSALQWYMQKRFKEFMGIPGMLISMDLASNGSSDRKAQVREEESLSVMGKVSNFPFLDLEEVFNIKDLGEEYRSPIRSDVPALLLSGSLDINTPAYQADILKVGMPNATHIVVKNAGHEQIQFHRDMTSTIIDFLDGNDVSQVQLAYPVVKFKSIK